MALLALERLAPSASQNQKGHFPSNMNAINDTKTLEMAKSAKETGNICDRLWQLLKLGLNAIFQMAQMA